MHHRLFSRELQLWIIVLCWILAALAAALYIPHAGKPFKIENIADPKADSSIAQKIMTTEFPFGGGKIFVLYTSKSLKANDPQFISKVKKSLDGAKNLSFEHRIISPYQNERQISDNNRIAYAVIESDLKADVLANSINEVNKALGEPKNLQIYIGGEPGYTADVNRLSEENLVRGELIALPLSLIALVFVFSGVMAALITIIIGIINITIVAGILYFLGHQMDLSIFVMNIATMLGLGLSLDYTMLMTYRFREEYNKSLDVKKTVYVTLGTAGKAVFFSGLIVLISIASLVFFPINILYSIGIGGITVVLVTIFSSVTLLPAALILFEKYITRTNKTLQHLSHENVHNHRWYKFANWS